MLLSKPAILRHIELGNIVIDPFSPRNLGPNSYDLTLGPLYYREQKPNTNGLKHYFNPFNKDSVKKVWGVPQCAQPLGWMNSHSGYDFVSVDPELKPGINEEDLVIALDPGENILAHTIEFVGGRVCVSMKMHARSSMGKSFFTVCRCAGCGDIGYINRWTMEITNNSRYYTILLPVGHRIAQAVFFETEPIKQEDDYSQRGKYQVHSSLELKLIKEFWQPEDMLPKMYKDHEAITAVERKRSCWL